MSDIKTESDAPLREYHIIATHAPLAEGDDGMFHVILPDIPEHMTLHIPEAVVHPEFGGFVTLVFSESRPVQTTTKLELVTD